MPQFIPSDVRVINPQASGGLFAPALGGLVEKGLAALFPSAQDELFRAQAAHYQTADQLSKQTQMQSNLAQMQYLYNSIQDPAARAAFAQQSGMDPSLLASMTNEAQESTMIRQNLNAMSGGPQVPGPGSVPPPTTQAPGMPPPATEPPLPATPQQGQLAMDPVTPQTTAAVTTGTDDLSAFEGIQQLPKFGPQAVASPGFQPPSMQQYSGPQDVVWSIYPRGNDQEQMQLRGWQDTLPLAQQTKKLMMSSGYFQKWLKGENPDPIDMSQFMQTTKQFEDQLINETAKRGELDPYSLAAAQNPKTTEDAMIMFYAGSAEGKEYLKAKGISDERIAEASQNNYLNTMPAGSRNNLYKNYILPRTLLGVEAMTHHTELLSKLSGMDLQKAQAALMAAQGRYIDGAQSAMGFAQARLTDAEAAYKNQVTELLPAQWRDTHLMNGAQIQQLQAQTEAVIQETKMKPGMYQVGLLMEANKMRVAAATEKFNTMMGVLGRTAGGSGVAAQINGNPQTKASVSRLDTMMDLMAKLTEQEQKAAQTVDAAKMYAGAVPGASDESMKFLKTIQAQRIDLANQIAAEREASLTTYGTDPMALLQAAYGMYNQTVGAEMDSSAKFNQMLANSMQPDGTIKFPRWQGSQQMIADGQQWEIAQAAPEIMGESARLHQQKYGKLLDYPTWVRTPIGNKSPLVPTQVFPTEADRKFYYDTYYAPGGIFAPQVPQGGDSAPQASSSTAAVSSTPNLPSGLRRGSSTAKPPVAVKEQAAAKGPNLSELKSTDKPQGPQAQVSPYMIMPDDQFIQAVQPAAFGPKKPFTELMANGYVTRYAGMAGEGNAYLFNEYNEPTVRVVVGSRAPIFTLSGILRSYPTPEALAAARRENKGLDLAVAMLAGTPQGKAAFGQSYGKTQTAAPREAPRNPPVGRFDPNSSPRF